MTQLPGGDIRWTSPAGREYVSTPANPLASPAQSREGRPVTRPGSNAPVIEPQKDPPVAGAVQSADDLERPWLSAA